MDNYKFGNMIALLRKERFTTGGTQAVITCWAT